MNLLSHLAFCIDGKRISAASHLRVIRIEYFSNMEISVFKHHYHMIGLLGQFQSRCLDISRTRGRRLKFLPRNRVPKRASTTFGAFTS